jgi:hypothetical protein
MRGKEFPHCELTHFWRELSVQQSDGEITQRLSQTARRRQSPLGNIGLDQRLCDDIFIKSVDAV